MILLILIHLVGLGSPLCMLTVIFLRRSFSHGLQPEGLGHRVHSPNESARRGNSALATPSERHNLHGFPSRHQTHGLYGTMSRPEGTRWW